MAAQIFQDLNAFGIKDAFALYAQLEQQKIDKGLAKSTNQINEWNAQAAFLSLQQQAQEQAAKDGKQAGSNKLLIAGAAALVLVLAYVALAK